MPRPRPWRSCRRARSAGCPSRACSSSSPSSRGLPQVLRTDNGPEFCGRAMLTWAHERGLTLRLIEPGKPNQNAYIESFNGRFRDECLNEHWFTSLAHAQAVIETWRREYNEERPKKGLGGLTPAAYAKTADEGNGYSHRRTLKPTATQDGGTSLIGASLSAAQRSGAPAGRTPPPPASSQPQEPPPSDQEQELRRRLEKLEVNEASTVEALKTGIEALRITGDSQRGFLTVFGTIFFGLVDHRRGRLQSLVTPTSRDHVGGLRAVVAPRLLVNALALVAPMVDALFASKRRQVLFVRSAHSRERVPSTRPAMDRPGSSRRRPWLGCRFRSGEPLLGLRSIPSFFRSEIIRCACGLCS